MKPKPSVGAGKQHADEPADGEIDGKKENRCQRRHGQDEASRHQRLLPARPGNTRGFLAHFADETDGGKGQSTESLQKADREAAGGTKTVQKVRKRVAGVEGLEPPASGFGDRRSSQLSYTPAAPRQAGPHGTRARYEECWAGYVKGWC